MSLENLLNNSPAVERIPSDLFSGHSVDMLRLDQIDFEVSGNKYFKLKYNIETAQNKGYTRLLTFGGAFSNHLLATAKACALVKLESIGIVRGESENANNPTLIRAQELGMQLVFVDRETYRNRDDFDYQKELREQYRAFVVPEGGNNYLGINGAMEISNLFDQNYDRIFVAAGTGSTAAGLMLNAKKSQIIAINVLKGGFMQSNIQTHLSNFLQNKEVAEALLSEHIVFEDGHCGGYAKYSTELLTFIREFFNSSGIQLDPIYTGKMALAAKQIISHQPRQKNLLIHTGGLQGISGFEQRYGIQLF